MRGAIGVSNMPSLRFFPSYSVSLEDQISETLILMAVMTVLGVLVHFMILMLLHGNNYRHRTIIHVHTPVHKGKMEVEITISELSLSDIPETKKSV